MNIKKKLLSIIFFQLFILNFFHAKRIDAIIPYYSSPQSQNLKEESISIGKSAYQLLYFGQTKESLGLAKLAISLNKKDEKLWTILAEAQIANKFYDKALESIEKGKGINPNFSELHFAESSIYLTQKENKKAKNSLIQGLMLDPENETAIFHLGNIFLIEKNYKQALKEFNKAIKIELNFWQAINNKGLAYYELEKTSQAINSFNKAISIAENAEPILALAASIKSQEKKRSIILAKKALKKDPNYVDSSFRKEQLWGEKLQNATDELFKFKELKNDIDLAREYIN